MVQKNRVPRVKVAEYLEFMGHKLRHVGKGSYTVDEHDSLKVTPEKNVFYWFSKGDGGGGNVGVRFLMEHLDGITDRQEQDAKFFEIYNAYRSHKVQQRSYEGYIEQHFDLMAHSFNQDISESSRYLTEVRGIHPKLVQVLFKQGLLAEEIKTIHSKNGNTFNATNLWYVWKNRKGEIVGADVQATKPSKTTDLKTKEKHQGYWKGIATGSPSSKENFNFQIGHNEQSDRLYVFEAPVDALSMWQLQISEFKGKTVEFVALSSVNRNAFEEYLRVNYLSDNPRPMPKEIHFAMDNDEAGRSFTERMSKMLMIFDRLNDVKIMMDVPQEKNQKDWNDTLRYGNDVVETYDLRTVELAEIQEFNPNWQPHKEGESPGPQPTPNQKHQQQLLRAASEKQVQPTHNIWSTTNYRKGTPVPIEF
jgi:hypothetical protein